MVPIMKTDVTIVWPERKLILDCKYYQEALVSRYDALRFRSGNLYQLNAYLTNQATIPGWESVEGMLLYPTNGHSLDQSFTLHGRHRIRIATLDLAMKWPDIEKKLLSLLAPALDQYASKASQTNL
jgi:5-methylcytosine-specific restriction enzyme subunit McrC